MNTNTEIPYKILTNITFTDEAIWLEYDVATEYVLTIIMFLANIMYWVKFYQESFISMLINKSQGL